MELGGGRACGTSQHFGLARSDTGDRRLARLLLAGLGWTGPCGLCVGFCWFVWLMVLCT